MPLCGCPLTSRTTQGVIGAAHGPREKFCWGIGLSLDLRTNPGRYRTREKICGAMGVFLDPKTNPGRHRGRPRVPGAMQWGYGGVP